MKVLVIEDKLMHQNSARETLAGHDLTVVDSFAKAIEVLTKEKFEAVLTDMNLPMSKMALHDEAFNPSEQVSYGFVLALLAAKHGAKYIAMLTDTNHHKGAMSAAIDCIAPTYYEWGEGGMHAGKPTVFHINDATAVFVHTPFLEDFLPDSDCIYCHGTGLCPTCDGTLISNWDKEACWCTREDRAHHKSKCGTCNGTLKYMKSVYERKDWGRVLKDLLENKEK